MFNSSLSRTLIITLSLLITNFAHAHAQPESQTPAAGAIFSSTQAPAEVRITYNDALEPAFSNIIVNDAQNKPISTAKAEIDPTTKKTMHVALPKLVAGIYQVKWVAVAADGHRTQGKYPFTVK